MVSRETLVVLRAYALTIMSLVHTGSCLANVGLCFFYSSVSEGIFSDHLVLSASTHVVLDGLLRRYLP